MPNGRSPPVFIRLADEGCGSEHDNSRDECCHAGIRQDFIENSGHCNPRLASPIRAATCRPLQHRGEKVKFVELEPLNTRKNGGYAATREANSGIRKKPAAAVARETSSAAARLPQATPKRGTWT